MDNFSNISIHFSWGVCVFKSFFQWVSSSYHGFNFAQESCNLLYFSLSFVEPAVSVMMWAGHSFTSTVSIAPSYCLVAMGTVDRFRCIWRGIWWVWAPGGHSTGRRPTPQQRLLPITWSSTLRTACFGFNFILGLLTILYFSLHLDFKQQLTAVNSYISTTNNNNNTVNIH